MHPDSIPVVATTPEPWPATPDGQVALAGLAALPITTGTRLTFATTPTDGVLALASAYDKRQACQLTLSSPDGSWKYLLDAGFCSIGQRFHIAIPRGLQEIHVESHDADDTLWVLADAARLPGSLPAIWLRHADIDLSARFLQQLECDAIAEFGWMGGCVLEAYDALALGGDSARWSNARDSWLANFLDDSHLRYQDPMGRPRVDEFITIEATLPIATVARRYPEHPIIDITLDFLGQHACRDATTEGCYTVAYPLLQIAMLRGRDEMQTAARAELRHRRDHLIHDGDLYLRNFSGRRTYRNWARGVAWYLLGHAECLRLAGVDGAWAETAEHLTDRAAWALRHQRPDGLWSNFFFEPELPADTAGSAGIATALLHCQSLGLLGPEATAAAERCWSALQSHIHINGWLGGTSPSNKRQEAAQHLPARVGETFGMGLAGLLAARRTIATRQH